jgi:replicative DNA helicase
MLANSKIKSVKTPPHSLEAERSVLGAILLDPDAWDKIAGVIFANDFYIDAHQKIFNAIAKLASKSQPFDALTLSEALKQAGDLEDAGGEVVLFELANSTPSAANVVTYAEIVRDKSLLRQLMTAGQDITELAFQPNEQEVRSILDIAESKIFKIAETRQSDSGPVEIKSIMASATQKLEQLSKSKGGVTGLPTGFKDLDQMTAGLQPGDLVVIAGRPSMGKTAFSMNIAEHAAIANNKPVLIFSLEMPSDALALRMLSSLGRVNQQRMRTGQLVDEDWPRLTSAVSVMSEAKMFIDDTPGITPTEMRAKARRIARQHGEIGLIVVDYLQLMRMGGKIESRTLEISEISRLLKGIAKELKTPLIAISQLNRSLEQRQDKRPIMSDLRESGAIEQDADVIAFVYRDEVYNENTESKGQAEIIIGKQRNGPIGKVRLTFLGEYTRFENFAHDAY